MFCLYLIWNNHVKFSADLPNVCAHVFNNLFHQGNHKWRIVYCKCPYCCIIAEEFLQIKSNQMHCAVLFHWLDKCVWNISHNKRLLRDILKSLGVLTDVWVSSDDGETGRRHGGTCWYWFYFSLFLAVVVVSKTYSYIISWMTVMCLHGMSRLL